MEDQIKLRRIMMLDPVNVGIFKILKVFPEHIASINSLPSGGTEVTIKGVDGQNTSIEVAQSEQEIKDLRNKCLELDGIDNQDIES